MAAKRRRLRIALVAMLTADIGVALSIMWSAVGFPGSARLVAIATILAIGAAIHSAVLVWIGRAPPRDATPDSGLAPGPAPDIEVHPQLARKAMWQAARLAALEATMTRLTHDLRGALSPAMLAAERLQSSADPTQHRSGGILLRCVERAAGLVNQAMDQTRAGGAATQTRPGALRAMVEAAAASIDATSMKVDARIDASLQVTADSAHIIQLLGELLRNADAAGASHTTISAACSDRTVLITVADNGPGLPAALQRDPFHQHDEPRAGWGFAIAQLLARAHGGTITLAETGPHGTVFTVSLPILRAPAG